MSLKQTLTNKLENIEIILNKENIFKYILQLYQININLFEFLNHDFTGYEADPKIGINSESSGIVEGQGTNPLLWELGHICYFYEYHAFQNILKDYKFIIDDHDLFDSFKTDRISRFEIRPYSKKFILEYYEKIFKLLIKILNDNPLDKYNYYLIFLTILHNHMHCESFIFTQKLLGIKNNITKYIFTNDSPNFDFEFVKINSGYFKQGTNEGENLFSFDNEMPQFEKYVESFQVSKYCVTEKILEKFIISGGYLKSEFWSKNGWRWIQRNNIKLPFYWFIKGDQYYIKDNQQIRNPSFVLPATHISWYEAEAISKWLGGRLPTESEWEYLATNGGLTKYPWGNVIIDKNIKGNLNYSGNICSVLEYDQSDNKDGVRQLFGNVWEWCQEAIYPYDGFKIDPVYKEFSYPFFGFKKVLRGGSWATPDILINSRYRNAQMPDCRIQFTGFRVVKSI